VTSLKGRVAIVTGAGRGMGRAIAIKLAETGADVALVDLEAPLESAELAGPSAILFAADVSSEAEDQLEQTYRRNRWIVPNHTGYCR
jgi:NAD(P)-dependent dehydrogenase (short-subunit alcohol dehydrogenase family)